jgi:hypothetical protein
MNIEELIDRLASNGKYLFAPPIALFSSDIAITHSLSEQIQRGNGFTEKQRALTIRLVTKYAKVLSVALNYDVNVDLVNPNFKHPVRKLSGTKSVEVQSFENGYKRILVKFPFNEGTVASFREYKKTIPRYEANEINWNAEDTAWVFAFTEPNVLFLSKLLGTDFTFDKTFAAAAEEITEIESNIDQYVPMVVFRDGKYSYKNTVDKIPQPTSTDLTEVLLDARKYGITCWDESIDIALESDMISSSIRTLLKNNSCEPIVLDSRELSDIAELLQHSNNVLFVIPGGTELAHLKTVHQHLKDNDIPNEQMTVMFRLDSSSGKMCNDYIKEHNLNGQVGDNIKFVCVSGKIPKPLIESGKRFDLVVHFGTNSAHYTLKNYIKSHYNVISMSLDNKNKELDLCQVVR